MIGFILAREILCGDGMDEILAGWDAYGDACDIEMHKWDILV